MSDPSRCPACKAGLLAESRFCHRCGLPLAGERARTLLHPGRVAFARFMLIFNWLGVAVGCLLILIVSIHTIWISGRLLIPLGMLTILAGLLARYYLVCLAGAMNGFWCLLILFLMALFRWGPLQAYWPVLTLGSVYAAATLPLFIWIYRHPPRRRHPWACQACGYLLYGLTEARCPECGLPFNPRRMPAPTEREEG